MASVRRRRRTCFKGWSRAKSTGRFKIISRVFESQPMSEEKAAAPRKSELAGGSVAQLSVPTPNTDTVYLFQFPESNGAETLHYHPGPRTVLVVNNGDRSSFFWVAGNRTSGADAAAYKIKSPPHSVIKVEIPTGTYHAFGAESGADVMYYSVHSTDGRDAAKLNIPPDDMALLDKLSIDPDTPRPQDFQDVTFTK
jgi:hypothetical protein